MRILHQILFLLTIIRYTTTVPIECPPRCLCISRNMASPASYCDGMKLSAIPQNIAENTEILSLQLNAIRNISENDFSRFRNLRRLNLKFNRIERISENAFKHLRHLKSLNLGYNAIKELQPEVFRNLVSLEELYLNNNFLANIAHQVLSHLPKLRTLHLQSNQLSSPFFVPKSLQLLNLAYNNLEFIATVMFSGHSNLKSLRLNNNKINMFEGLAFVGLGLLEELYLDNNVISTFNRNLLQDKPKLKLLSLYNNPLLCDCNIHWLLNFIKDEWSIISNINATVCQSPPQLHGKVIKQIESDDINCFGSWGEWNSWSVCKRPCSGELRHRTRLCHTTADVASSCRGESAETESCKTQPCSKGVASSWSEWSLCSASCNIGHQSRKRHCINPYTRSEKAVCEENLTEIRACGESYCPVDGSWHGWSGWSDCSKKCGLGLQTRERMCNKPLHGGQPCHGSNGETQIEKKICFKALCPPKTQWSDWSPYTSCSKTCGKGHRSRRRTCLNENNKTIDILNVCPGEMRHVVECEVQSCTRHGDWSAWSSWTLCEPIMCKRYRSRRCDTTNNGEITCAGNSVDHRNCSPEDCVVHSIWGQWAEWSACSKSCNGGVKERVRKCPGSVFPRVTCGGDNDSAEVDECNTHKCEQAEWMEWSRWSGCLPNQGKETRKRECVGRTGDCTGRDKDRRHCNMEVQKRVGMSKTGNCIPRRRIANGFERIERIKNGFIAKYSCQSYYKLKGGVSEMTCINGEGWSSAVTPYCSPMCGKPEHKSSDHWLNRARLLGGKHSVAHSWPWQVAIEVNTREKGWVVSCGGTLVYEKHVLTAAHCLYDKNPTRMFEPDEMKIYVGMHNISERHVSNVSLFSVRSMEKHPNFDLHSLDNDIAVLELNRQPRFSDKILPICLPTTKQKDLSKRGKVGTVVGWGVTTKGHQSELLNELRFPVVSRRECVTAYLHEYNVTHSMFCAGKKTGNEDTCKGDSGGGFYFRDHRRKKWTLQGIVSWGSTRCGETGKYSVYTRVSNFTNWIRRIVKKRSK